VSKETKVTGLDADIEKLGSDIDALALGVDAYLVCRENGASRAGQRPGSESPPRLRRSFWK
jgi:hypothetical protein